MPIYEYKCDLCNGMWEEIQKFSDDPLTVCKSCEKEGLNVLSAPNTDGWEIPKVANDTLIIDNKQ